MTPEIPLTTREERALAKVRQDDRDFFRRQGQRSYRLRLARPIEVAICLRAGQFNEVAEHEAVFTVSQHLGQGVLARRWFVAPRAKAGSGECPEEIAAKVAHFVAQKSPGLNAAIAAIEGTIQAIDGRRN